ncbi:MAG: fibronectin type III domain-containing protein [Bacteroidetes bacterium]|nr:fibronectin type III domain-containing protein [Bacteroidota bacterium]
MKTFRILTMVALAALLSSAFSACDDNTTDPVDTDPVLAAPSNLKAASANNAVFLSWTASIDEGESNFGSYEISVLNKSTNETLAPRTAGKGITSVRVDGLTNGIRYQFTIRSVTNLGKEGTTFSTIEWSPAFRQTTDLNGLPIKVYATTSTSFNSAIDLYNDQGKAEVIPQSGQTFKDRGDLYLYAQSNTSTLSIISPDQANNQGMVTQFSNATPVDIDDLDAQLAMDPPTDASYTQKELTLNNGTVSAGKVYFGRIVRGTDMFYFRLLVKKGGNGTLVQGSGADRYIEMVASFQNAPNNPFAKH